MIKKILLLATKETYQHMLVFSAGQDTYCEIQMLWINSFIFFPLNFHLKPCLWNVSVHWSAHVWWGDCHGHCFPEPEKAAHWYLSQRECRRVSGQPSCTLGPGHRHSESLTAGKQKNASQGTSKPQNWSCISTDLRAKRWNKTLCFNITYPQTNTVHQGHLNIQSN